MMKPDRNGITDEQGEAWLRERLRRVLDEARVTREAGSLHRAAVVLDGGELRFGTSYRWRLLDDAWRDEGE